MGFKLGMSNIAWGKEDDDSILSAMRHMGFSGLEIAPTRIIEKSPYNHLNEASQYAEKIRKEYGLNICSMQSIWYGRNEKLFGSKEERAVLTEYTKKAILFAESMGVHNLVFGCPQNRNILDNYDIYNIAIPFFRELGEYAVQHGTVLAMEANPVIYHTNFINTTQEAISLIQKVNSKGFLLNLDIGTMIWNGEKLDHLKENECLIHHVHISEPFLKQLQKREFHQYLINYLKECNYNHYISVEMSKQKSKKDVIETMEYICELI